MMAKRVKSGARKRKNEPEHVEAPEWKPCVIGANWCYTHHRDRAECPGDTR